MPMLRRARFYLSWWAYSFPVAALAISSMLMYHQSDVRFFFILSWVIFALLFCLVVGLAVLTVRAAIQRKICVEE